MPTVPSRTTVRWAALLLLAAAAGTSTAQDQQLITPRPALIEVAVGDRVSATIEYSTSAGVTGLTGLGLRIHWNTSALTLAGLRSVLGSGLVAQGVAEPDSADFDGNPSTDTFLQVAWADLAGSWPGSATADLLTVDFDVRPGFPGSTLVGFSASSTAAGYTLGAMPLRIIDPGGSSCVSGGETLCLGEGRFEVTVDWRDFAGNVGGAQVVPASSIDSGLFWFFDADNWEMLVKVLDGCSLNGNFWVFAAATTNVEFTLTVRDTLTSQVSVYVNELGVSAPAITDVEALPVCSPGAQAPTFAAASPEPVLTPRAASRPEEGTPKTEACVEDGETLCLNGGRFQVRGSWRDFGDETGSARVVSLPVESDDSGLFWFFGPNNWEVLIKILDGCSINNRYWVFSAATTNVEYSLEITDTQTRAIRTYTNPLGISAAAVTDTDAFATCP
ncbi:MAG: hypothetical protein AAF657_00720 [Acidobacteriota bacterium]